MKDPIFVHAHIFKNAGSTFDWSLSKNFGSEFMVIREPLNKLWEDRARFCAVVQENRPLKAISAHWVNLRDMDQWDFPAIPFLMLRNPLERARSVYNFERKRQDRPAAKSSLAAKGMPFKEYVQWCRSQPLNAIIQNNQTRHCASKLMGPLTAKEVDIAVALLQRIPVVGIVDLYDETMVLLEQVLLENGLTVDLSYVMQNTTQDNALTVEQKLDSVNDELGTLFDDLRRDNEYDLFLYETSRQQLLAQCDALDDFDNRLADFRRRCGAP